MLVQPYLFFEGRCEEAVDFYRQALGAQVTSLMRYQDTPDPPFRDTIPTGSEDKIMHASLTIGDTVLMASDGMCTGQPAFQGFSLSLTVPSKSEADRLFAALSDGGKVQTPLEPTFWSPRFGTVTDRFGVSWMITVTG